MKIPSEILRVYKTLHTWTGIVSGLVLFIGFFAGALTLFKQPLDRWASPPALAWQSAAAVDDLLVPEVLAAHPAARAGYTVHLRRQEHIPGPISWQAGPEGRGEIETERWYAGRNAQGQLQAAPLAQSPLGELVDLLHRTAGIPGRLGDEHLGVYVMGVAAVLYFLALVSGLVLYLPTLVKDFLALRRGKNRKRFWLDAHNLVGLASLPFHLVISLTVIVFAFHDEFYDALGAAVYRAQPMFTPPAGMGRPGLEAPMLSVSRVLERVQQEAPGFEPLRLEFMGLDSPRPMLRVALVDGQHRLHGPEAAYLVLNPYTGRVLNDSMLPGRENAWSAWVNTFFAVHFGSFGGDTGRWLYLALGLGGAFLFYSGNLLWLESRRRRQNSSRGSGGGLAVQRMAAATVGSCLGAMLGIGLALLAAKLLHASGWGLDLQTRYLAAYYLGWGGCLLHAFLRGASRAAPVQLSVCALVALAIPLSSWLGPWAHGSTWGVDLGALILALALAWAARLTRRRLAGADPDTVWARGVAQVQRLN